jgi:IS5 family transposase
MSEELKHRYIQALRLRIQTLDKKAANKLYSLHEPDIVCIAKGKARTPYEFGHKVSVVTTADEQLVLDCQALKGNPYDGHTLDQAILRSWHHTGTLATAALVDRGYRGSQHSRLTSVHISGKKQGLGKAHTKQHRRNSVEAIIGHMKADGQLERCHLKGLEGSKIHALLCGMGQNMRKILKHLRRCFYVCEYLVLYRFIERVTRYLNGSMSMLTPRAAA